MRTRRFRRFFVYGILLLLFGIGTSVVVGLRVFSVTISANTCVTPRELFDHKRAPLWLWEPYSVDTIRQFPCIKKITTSSKFPSRVLVTIEERVAVLRIMPLAGDQVQPETFLMDNSGFVFRKTDEDGHLPSIFIAQPVTIGDEFKELGALPWDEVLTSVKQGIGTPQKIVYRTPDLEITFDALFLYMPASKALPERLLTAAAIVNHAVQEGKPVRLLDYRFERPVISY